MATRWQAVLTAVALAAFAGLAAGTERAPRLELFLAADNTFALYRPPGWDVRTQDHANGRTVMVLAPRGDAFAQVAMLRTEDRGNDSVQLAAQTLRGARAQIPSLRLTSVRSTADRRRTVVEFEHDGPAGTVLRGRQYFLSNYPEARVFGYATEATRLPQLQATLVSVLANFTVLDPSQFRTAASGAAAPAEVALQPRRLDDGSATLALPPGWQMIGAKGAVLTRGGDGNSGFAFATAEFWGPSSMPYFDSSRLPGVILAPYVPPVDALLTLMSKYGSRDFRVLQRSADPARAGAVSAGLKRRAEVETALLAFSNENGMRCRGYYEVIGTRPMPSGQWGILYFAVWAPEASFDRDLPTLLRIAASYRIDERWAADYIARGIENLKRQMARTSQMKADTARSAREASMAAFQERSRSNDYIDYKRTGTIRGEQEWVSQVEGGTLYKSDRWGLSREGERVAEGEPYNYYNFDGRNPRHNEQMTPVDASREVFESIFVQQK